MDNVRSYVTEKAAAPETVDDGVLAVEEAEPAEETNVIVLEEIPRTKTLLKRKTTETRPMPEFIPTRF